MVGKKRHSKGRIDQITPKLDKQKGLVAETPHQNLESDDLQVLLFSVSRYVRNPPTKTPVSVPYFQTLHFLRKLKC